MDSENRNKNQKLYLKNDKTIIKSNESLNQYEIGETLAKSSFGKVKLGIHKITKEKVNF
jgi:hypothetical protein